MPAKIKISLDHTLILILLLISSFALYYAYTSIEFKKQETKSLVDSYCTHCHSLPNPQQLPKKTWPQVFEAMEVYFSHPNSYPIYSQNISKSFLYDAKEFNRIKNHYINLAPTEDAIRISQKAPSHSIIPSKHVTKLNIEVDANTALLSVNYSPEQNRLFLAQTGEQGHHLKIYDSKSNAYPILRSLAFDEAPIDIFTQDKNIFVTLAGGVSVDHFKSAILKFDNINQNSPTTLLKGLSRATKTLYGDFDHDGKQDIFFCGFGDNTGTGYVSIFWGKGNGEFKEQRLKTTSGALKVIISDINHDGLEDFLVLFAQSSQNLILFKSTSKRKYVQINLIQRPIGWGFMDFVYIDIDNDGEKEIITAAGNNMELVPPPLKPYHGIYIWKNQGDLTFTQQQFFPMYGASQLIAGDFDGDTRIDIAATSLIPDWTQDNPLTFIALLQKENMDFAAYELPPHQWRRFSLLTTQQKKKII